MCTFQLCCSFPHLERNEIVRVHLPPLLRFRDPAMAEPTSPLRALTERASMRTEARGQVTTLPVAFVGRFKPSGLQNGKPLQVKRYCTTKLKHLGHAVTLQVQDTSCFSKNARFR